MQHNQLDDSMSEMSLHDEIVDLRRKRGLHLMDESDYTSAVLAIIARERAQAAAEARRKAYHQIMLKTDRKYPAPHPQSPMEFTRDAEIFNQVTAKWEKVVGDVLDREAGEVKG